RAGDLVHIPGGEEHWHGAGPSTLVVHLAITIADTDWLDAVSDADYMLGF
nr:cupin domain-containing protein [Thermoleophilaceae bacterium]